MLENIRRLWRTWIDGRGVALLGIVAGVAGFMLARQYLVNADRSIATKYAQAYAPRRVIVAAGPLDAGVSLSMAQLAVRSMPQRFLPSGAVSAEAVGSVLDAKLRVAMKPGDPLERSMLHVAPPSLATRLPLDRVD